MPTIDPTVSELLLLDLPGLMEMLVDQTANYSQLLRTEGLTTRTAAVRKRLFTIQTAIAHKRMTENLVTAKCDASYFPVFKTDAVSWQLIPLNNLSCYSPVCGSIRRPTPV